MREFTQVLLNFANFDIFDPPCDPEDQPCTPTFKILSFLIKHISNIWVISIWVLAVIASSTVVFSLMLHCLGWPCSTFLRVCVPPTSYRTPCCKNGRLWSCLYGRAAVLQPMHHCGSRGQSLTHPMYNHVHALHQSPSRSGKEIDVNHVHYCTFV